jgi:DNA-binding IclR family transcriptional regulator
MADTKRDWVWNEALAEATEGREFTTATIEDKSGASRRTVSNVLRTMARMGWLARDEGDGPNPDRWSAGPRVPNTLFTSEGSA